jgi:tRNA(fMet)-specific endonuclease VapC
VLHILDTDIASYFIRDRVPSIKTKLLELPYSDVCISVVTKAELLYGLKRLNPGHRLHIGVLQFLENILVLPWGLEIANHYANIRHQLVSTGQPIGELDMMIAAHSVSTGAVLVTNNTRHYQRINGVILANWALPES